MLNCFIAFIIFCVLNEYYGEVVQDVNMGYFGKKSIWFPLLSSLLGIFIHKFMCNCLAKYITETDVLHSIGQETFHIMSLHLFIVYLINCCIAKFYLKINIHTINP